MTVIDAPVELYRDPEHKYWLGRERLLGVNETITGLGLEEDGFYTAGASNRGHVVHAVLAGVARGLTFDWDLLDPDLHGWVKSGILWLDHMRTDPDFEIMGVEEMRFHPTFRFAGQIDLVVRWRGYLWIMDWKSGKASKMTRFKMGAYAMLFSPPTAILQTKKAAIELQADGSCARPVYFNETQHFHDGNRFVAYHTTLKDKILYGPKETNS